MFTEVGLGMLENERQVTRILTRYCELLDTGQVDRIATEVYTAEAVADYHFDVLTGRRAINDYLLVNMGRFKETAHALSNVSVKACDGQLAEVSSMMTAWHWLKKSNAPDAEAPINFGQIVVTADRLERTSEGWRITERRARALGPSFVLSAGPVVLPTKVEG
ncbi:MAG: nuclear transport factor 2 family protein [Caulobacter sp.]|nr:nuclear transport factor 2 family protein [Caulobacter sp.]